MYIAVRKMSHYVDALLKCTPTGSVHSVYRKTINLSVSNKIIALQTDGSPLSPISLITALSAADLELLAVKRGDPVTISKNTLLLRSCSGCFSFSYACAARYDLKLSCIHTPETNVPVSSFRDRLAENIKAALVHADSGGFEAIFNNCPEENLSLMLLAAKKHITQSLELYQNGKKAEAAEQLAHLLGLGIGLTPSGDDFLCGVLAGLRLTGQEELLFAKVLKSEIAKKRTDTIDISAAFLSCALEGQYSLAVKSLETLPASCEIADSFSAIGHSSGMDTLCGILHVLQSVK